jgi:hypothetical protein
LKQDGDEEVTTDWTVRKSAGAALGLFLLLFYFIVFFVYFILFVSFGVMFVAFYFFLFDFI